MSERELMEAIEDLWACIGLREIEHLQPETVALARRVHTLLSHPELGEGDEAARPT